MSIGESKQITVSEATYERLERLREKVGDVTYDYMINALLDGSEAL